MAQPRFNRILNLADPSQAELAKTVKRSKDLLTKTIKTQFDSFDDFLASFIRQGVERGHGIEDLVNSNFLSDRMDAVSRRAIASAQLSVKTSWLAAQNEGVKQARKEIRAVASRLRTAQLGRVASDDPILDSILDGVKDLFSQYEENILAIAREHADRPAIMRSKLRAESAKFAERVSRASAYITNRGLNEGRFSVYSDADNIGYSLQKVWKTHHTERTCPECAALDGNVVNLEEGFPIDASFGRRARGVYLDLFLPPRHPNCRCEVVPWSPTFATDDGTITPMSLQSAAREAFNEATSPTTG